jgi:hypothetical protein
VPRGLRGSWRKEIDMTDSARDPLEEADTVEQIAPVEGAEPTVDPQRSSEDGSVEDATVDIDPDILPETQGEDPLSADLGEEGQGDLAPEDE